MKQTIKFLSLTNSDLEAIYTVEIPKNLKAGDEFCITIPELEAN